MYEVYLKSWYQEIPNETQDECMYESESSEDAFEFLKVHAEHYMENYPLIEMGIRLKKCIFEPVKNITSASICMHCGREKYQHS